MKQGGECGFGRQEITGSYAAKGYFSRVQIKLLRTIIWKNETRSLRGRSSLAWRLHENAAGWQDPL